MGVLAGGNAGWLSFTLVHRNDSSWILSLFPTARSVTGNHHRQINGC